MTIRSPDEPIIAMIREQKAGERTAVMCRRHGISSKGARQLDHICARALYFRVSLWPGAATALICTQKSILKAMPQRIHPMLVLLQKFILAQEFVDRIGQAGIVGIAGIGSAHAIAPTRANNRFENRAEKFFDPRVGV